MCSTSGCVPVSVPDLPDGSSEIDFSETVDNRTGWRTAEKSHTFKGTREELVFMAAKAALVHEDFEATTASLEEGVVIGKHGMTLVAGFYFNQLATDTEIRIIVKSAVTLDPPSFAPVHWVDDDPRKLFEAMRLFIEAETGTKPDITSQR
jgi:hypothetical protein